MEVVKRWLHT